MFGIVLAMDIMNIVWATVVVGGVGLVLGLLLGSIMEKNMRQALVISRGDWSYFVTRPISLGLLIFVVVTFAFPFIKSAIKKGKAKKASA